MIKKIELLRIKLYKIIPEEIKEFLQKKRFTKKGLKSKLISQIVISVLILIPLTGFTAASSGNISEYRKRLKLTEKKIEESRNILQNIGSEEDKSSLRIEALERETGRFFINCDDMELSEILKEEASNKNIDIIKISINSADSEGLDTNEDTGGEEKSEDISQEVFVKIETEGSLPDTGKFISGLSEFKKGISLESASIEKKEEAYRMKSELRIIKFISDADYDADKERESDIEKLNDDIRRISPEPGEYTEGTEQDGQYAESEEEKENEEKKEESSKKEEKENTELKSERTEKDKKSSRKSEKDSNSEKNSGSGKKKEKKEIIEIPLSEYLYYGSERTANSELGPESDPSENIIGMNADIIHDGSEYIIGKSIEDFKREDEDREEGKRKSRFRRNKGEIFMDRRFYLKDSDEYTEEIDLKDAKITGNDILKINILSSIDSGYLNPDARIRLEFTDCEKEKEKKYYREKPENLEYISQNLFIENQLEEELSLNENNNNEYRLSKISIYSSNGSISGYVDINIMKYKNI